MTNDDSTPCQCGFCGRLSTVETAVLDGGWEPYFNAGPYQIDQAVCPDCHRLVRFVASDGEFEAAGKVGRPLHVLTFVPAAGPVNEFYFTHDPAPEIIAHLASYRPGAVGIQSVRTAWE